MSTTSDHPTDIAYASRGLTELSTCSELVGQAPSNAVDLHAFGRLHPEGRRLISGWHRRAWDGRDVAAAESFEPFIYLWIAFNGWAVATTALDQDRQVLERLAASMELGDRFQQRLNSHSSRFSAAANRFATYWPILSARDLRQRGLLCEPESPRKPLLSRLIAQGVEHGGPPCFLRHWDNAYPLDWPHFIWAVYQVRCNLFHGAKSIHSEMDAQIVHSAYQALLYFLHDADLLRV